MILARDRSSFWVSGNLPVRCALEEFVDEGLIGLGLFGRETADPREKTRSDANGDQPLGVPALGSAHAASTFQLGVC